MIIEAPTSIKNSFSELLQDISVDDRFKSIEQYYKYLKKDIYRNRGESLVCKTIDDRFDQSKFFYYPTEKDTNDMYCLERATSMYLAINELYPKSNPALITTEDNNSNIHASVLFSHEGDLWGSDLSHKYFSKISLEPKKIIIHEKEKRIIEVKNIFEIEPKNLQNMINKLRVKEGSIDFFYKSGQRAGYSTDGYWIHMNHFMKITKDQNIVSQLRMYGDGFPEKNASINIITNPFTNERNINFVRYEKESWGHLIDVDNVQIPKESPYKSQSIVNTSHITALEDAAYYLVNGHKNTITSEQIKIFSEHKKVQSRFGKEIEISIKNGEENHQDFLKYLCNRFSDPEKLPEEYKRIDRDQDTKEIYDTMELLTEQFSERCYLQYIPSFLKYSRDSIRYANEISEQIIKNTK